MIVVKPNDIILVNLKLPHEWAAKFYFARVVECEDDGDNWQVDRCRIIGETEDRLPERDDAVKGYSRIWQPDKQAAAQQLASKQWGVKGYASRDEVKAAILELAP